MKIRDMLEALRRYDGPLVRIMEVCGTHTAAIAKSGIRPLLPPKISLLSGPGCPVCVTPDGYIDGLRDWALRRGAAVCSFGDMLKVPGRTGSLGDARAEGGDIRVLYSPFDALKLAKAAPDTLFVFAAVGFETIAPVYALMAERMAREGVENLRLACALKTMPQVLDMLCAEPIDGFLAPGHVAAVTGADAFAPLAEAHKKPFCVAGFTDAAVIAGIYDLVRQVHGGAHRVHNLYPQVVTSEGNRTAQAAIRRVFEPCDAVWRGLGRIPGSGLRLREPYRAFAADLPVLPDAASPAGCRCGDVITGRIVPDACPLFGRACTPFTPRGPCMVSQEGACGVWYTYRD